MGFMAKKILFLSIFLAYAFTSYAAELKSTVEDNKVSFKFTFQKGYSAFEQLADETSNTLIFSFDTSENLVFERENYFDIPIKSAYLTTKDRKRFFVEFKNTPIEPIINKTGKEISIVFPIPLNTAKDNNTTLAVRAATPVPAAGNNNAGEIGAGSYARMLLGLTFVLIIIMVLFWILKVFYKKQVYSDIPGSGRLLGKVDLELRKSLYFYEIGDIIYIIGVTDNSMNVIDKVLDDAEAAKIRAGFIKKHDFKGYMNFFKRKELLDDDLSSSNAMVEEKLNNMRKRSNKVD